MSRRLSKLIFFAGVDEELEHIIGGTHHVDSWRPLHFQVYLVVVEKWLLRARVKVKVKVKARVKMMNKFKKMSHRNA